MLWHKAWIETRWRFLIGLGILLCSAGANVLLYPQVMKLMPSVPPADPSSAVVRQIREAAELMRSYRGYIFAQWFRQNLPQLWTIMAALLGSGGMLTQGAALFTLWGLCAFCGALAALLSAWPRAAPVPVAFALALLLFVAQVWLRMADHRRGSSSEARLRTAFFKTFQRSAPVCSSGTRQATEVMTNGPRFGP